ncbi:hypothetical protein DKX38_006010 [Salix brachista]|uniref:Uncharacterized protein n=1 Tax=Salix brachista TaxID=2182728 RepID=A0A5N5N337_9ROSI|nr:hypothetical protein DKX38_006010 [Salix brachista]
MSAWFKRHTPGGDKSHMKPPEELESPFLRQVITTECLLLAFMIPYSLITIGTSFRSSPPDHVVLIQAPPLGL